MIKMAFDIFIKGIPDVYRAYDPVDVLLYLEEVGDEYNFEAQIWAEECDPGDVYEDEYCRIVSLLDDRFC